MNWEIVNTLVAILTLAFTIFLEWPRVKDRLQLTSLRTTSSHRLDKPINRPQKPIADSPHTDIPTSFLGFWAIWVASAVIIALGLQQWQDSTTYQAGEILVVIPSAFAVLSLCQWLLLRKELPNSNWWILASAFPVFILELIDYGTGNSFSDALLMIGFAQGFSQWLILKSNFKKANIWWIVSTVSWPLGLLAQVLIADNIHLLPLEVGIIIYETIQGTLLVWLLDQRRIQQKL